MLIKPVLHKYWALALYGLSSTTGEATVTRSPHTASREQSLLTATRESLGAATKTQSVQPKIINKQILKKKKQKLVLSRLSQKQK